METDPLKEDQIGKFCIHSMQIICLKTNLLLAEIANRTLAMYKLGPIFEFHKSTIAAKEKSLALFLCKSLNLHDGRTIKRSTSKNMRNDSFVGDLRRLQIETLYLEDIQSYDPQVKPLLFNIDILQYNTDKMTSQVFFMIPSPKLPQQDKKPGVLTYYPLLLFKSTLRLRQQIITWFEKFYVAACTPLFMYPTTMVEAIDIWVDSLHDIKEKQESHIHVPDRMFKPPLVLEYRTGDEEMSKIVLKIPYQQVLDICARIPDRRRFLSTFEKHVEKSVHFKLNSLTLERVSNSIATVRKDGRIKVCLV